MHFGKLILAALVLSYSGTAFAQAWTSYASEEDRFAISFPGAPTVEETEWIDEDGNARPARRYSARRGDDIYTLIAVDFSDAAFNLLRGSFAHAATVYRQMGRVTYDGFSQVDRINGQQLQITLDSGRRLYFGAYLEGGILYILDANVSARSAPPGVFQQGLIVVDKDGVRVRYTQTGERILRTDDLPEALGGPDLDGPILEGTSDEYINLDEEG